MHHSHTEVPATGSPSEALLSQDCVCFGGIWGTPAMLRKHHLVKLGGMRNTKTASIADNGLWQP